MTNDDDDELVSVPVPKRHLKLIYQTLARAMTEEDPNMIVRTKTITSSPSRSGTLPFQERSGVHWTTENLRKLRKGLRCDAPIAMLDMAASTPNLAVYFEDVSMKLGQPGTTTRVQIGTLTKVIKRDFGVDYDHAVWPVTVKWDADSGKMYYIMDEVTAQAWYESSEA